MKEVKYQAKVTYTNLNKKRAILTPKLDTPEDVCVWMTDNLKSALVEYQQKMPTK